MTEEGGDSIRKNGINGVSVTSSTNSNSTLSSTTSTTITTTNNNNCNNHYSIDEFVHNKSPKRPTATTSGSGLGGGAQTPPSPSIQNLNHSTLHNHDKSPGPGVPPTSDNNKTTTSGGRLQFFKDGKFILELARAREGEKTSWVSVPAVPRKTYWPPSISTSTSHNFHKHESSTSLSFSDDNSSIQSSPWQRDHCWKQTTPRHNISSEMTLYYHRPHVLRLSKGSINGLRMKRRRPYDTTTKYKLSFHKRQKKTKTLNGDKKRDSNDTTVAEVKEENVDSVKNGSDSMDDSEVAADSATTESINGVESHNVNNNCTTDQTECNNSEINIKDEPSVGGNGTSDSSDDMDTEDKIKIVKNKSQKTNNLISIIQKLIDKIPANQVLTGNIKVKDSLTTTQSSTPSASISIGHSHHHHHHPHQHVSPRKRILRDFEKVSLDDSTKRLRSKNNTSNNNNKTINSNGTITPITTTTPTLITTPVSRPISSYSITSLLAHSNSSSNNNNNNINNNCNTNDNKKENITSQQQQSPQSPESQQHKYDQTTTPLSSFRRKSPSYPNHNNNITSSPSSGLDYSNSNNYPFMLGRSPDMSPSPEQQQHGFTRYRHNPYSTSGGGSNSGTSGGNHHQSSPNYPRFTPSPNNTLEKYRTSSAPSSNYQGGSPHHHLLNNNNSSPSHLNHLNYSRQQSPTSSIPGYQQYYHQNLHSSNSNNNHIKSPPPTPLNNYYNRIRERDKSPSVSPNNDRHYNNNNNNSNINNNNNNQSTTSASTPPTTSTTTTTSIRNVPKKTPALRQQFESPPSMLNKNEENIENNLHNKMHDYSDMKTTSLSGIDVDNIQNSLIRPTLIPSSSAQQQHSQHQQLQPPHPGMYYLYPPHLAAAMAAAASAPSSSSSPSQSAVAAAQQSPYFYPYTYRHPLWPSYPTSVVQNHHTLNRIPILNYASGLGPPTHLSSASNPWAALQSNSMSSLGSSLAEDISYSKLKDDNNSDVPLNLSKH